MADVKHTPGPWEIIEGDFRGVKIEGPEQVEVARCPGDKQGRIYARLIAAAPELLEVAQGILAADMLQYLPAEYVSKVRAAIAKATGEAPFACKYCGSPSWIDPSDQSPPLDYCHAIDHAGEGL